MDLIEKVADIQNDLKLLMAVTDHATVREYLDADGLGKLGIMVNCILHTVIDLGEVKRNIKQIEKLEREILTDIGKQAT